MSKYMLVLLLSGIVPFAVSFWPPLGFYKNLRALVLTISSILFIYGSWDVIATYRQHWYFNPHSVWPLRVINLPVEEILFFVVIPFCCLFTWEALGFIAKRKIK